MATPRSKSKHIFKNIIKINYLKLPRMTSRLALSQLRNLIKSSRILREFSTLRNAQTCVEKIPCHRNFITSCSLNKIEELSVLENLEDFQQLSFSEEVGHLPAILKCDETTAKRILRLYPKVYLVSPEDLKNRFKYLVVNKGIASDRIHVMPWLLTSDSDTFEHKVKEVMSILNVDMATALPFTKLNIDQLYRLKSIWAKDKQLEVDLRRYRFKNRFGLIASWLNIKEDDVIYMCAKYWRIGGISLDRIRKICTILSEARCDSNYVMDDPWIFTHNIKLMIERKELLNEQNIPDVRPWMLRCEYSILEKHMLKCNLERTLRSGHPDLTSFIQEKLDCSEEEAERIFERVPMIKNASAVKLNNMVDYLQSKGYTSAEILKSPWILARSKETVQARYEQMQRYTFFLPTALSILSLNSKAFEDLVRRLNRSEANRATKKT